jgi:hypothetical protein
VFSPPNPYITSLAPYLLPPLHLSQNLVGRLFGSFQLNHRLKLFLWKMV